MSKRRSKLDYSDLEFSDILDTNVIARINMANVTCVLFFLWIGALALHISYNVYVGMQSSALHIESQQKWHDLCAREALVRENDFEKCQVARIEKDLSVGFTTVNYVLHHTNVCIVTSCYAVFLDLTANLGWLLIGVSLVAAFFLFIAMRHSNNNSAPQFYLQDTPQREMPLIRSSSSSNNGRKGQIEIVEIKAE